MLTVVVDVKKSNCVAQNSHTQNTVVRHCAARRTTGWARSARGER